MNGNQYASKIKVDPELESLIPPLSSEEFEQLKANILESGECHDPLLIWNGTIIDGHNRWRIIQENPQIAYQVKEMDFSSRSDAMAWMIRNQLGRRNLTKFARTELSLKLKPLLVEEAEKRMKAGKADPTQNSAGGKTGEVRDEIAKAANVSHDTVSKVERLIEKAPEEVKEQLRKGEVSIHKAYNKIRESAQPKPAAPTEQPKHTTASESFTINLSKSDQMTIQKLSKDLRFCSKGNKTDNYRVFRFMLDYFKSIVDEATEWKESAKDFIPDPSAQAVANYFRPIDTTEALAEWIVFTSQQFAGNIWTSIAYETELCSKPKQKEQLAAALKESMNFIAETYHSLEQRQLNENE